MGFLNTKKVFYYNFFPTKEEEEELHKPGRVLVEIRDDCRAPVADPENPWVMKKTLNQNEIESGKLVLTWHDTSEHILRYWSLGQANFAALGYPVGVTVWDFTQELHPKNYNAVDHDTHLQMLLQTDCFSLSCKPLMVDRNFQVFDEIGLCWSCTLSGFMIKLLLDDDNC